MTNPTLDVVSDRVPLGQAALRLRKGRWATLGMLLRGELGLSGGQDEHGRWFVNSGSLEEAERRLAAPPSAKTAMRAPARGA